MEHFATSRNGWQCFDFPSVHVCCIYLDVLVDCFDAFDSDEDAPDSIEDEHRAIFECSADATTRQMFSDVFPSCNNPGSAAA